MAVSALAKGGDERFLSLVAEDSGPELRLKDALVELGLARCDQRSSD